MSHAALAGQLWNGRPSDVMMNAAKAQLEKVCSKLAANRIVARVLK